MAKETKFTDITLEVCGKQCHFNRVTNQTLTSFSDKTEKDYEKLVKAWTDKAQELSLNGEKIQREIARKEKTMNLLEQMEEPDIDRMLKLNSELEDLEEKMNDLTDKMVKHNSKNPTDTFNKRVDQTLGEKTELLLDNITAQEFLDNATFRDTVIATNLEKYYQMAMMGDRYKKIEVEIDKDMERFLEDQERIREQRREE